MNPEIQAKFDDQKKLIDEMQKTIEKLQDEYINHRHSGLDSSQLDGTSFKETPFAKVVNPTTAGASYNQVVAQSSVNAINSIITILETTKITSDQ